MKKLLDTIYVTSKDAYLHVKNDTIVVSRKNYSDTTIPALRVENIVCFGNMKISTPFLLFCSNHNISLSFHSEYGRFYGRLSQNTKGNVLLRKAQFTLSENKAADIVRNILIAKIRNSRFMLMKSSRDINDEVKKDALIHTSEILADSVDSIINASDIDTMRGIEGATAQSYFRVFDFMIKTDDPLLVFERRSKHPPENRINALLSFTYMLLKNDVESALESVGIDVECGYLHTLRSGHPSMALDLMEELRSIICDRLVVALINKRQIKSDDFEDFDCEYHLKDKPKKLLLQAWTKRKQEIILHTYFNKKIQLGLIPYAQSMLLARYLRGNIDTYPPFMWR